MFLHNHPIEHHFRLDFALSIFSEILITLYSQNGSNEHHTHIVISTYIPIYLLIYVFVSLHICIVYNTMPASSIDIWNRFVI